MLALAASPEETELRSRIEQGLRAARDPAGRPRRPRAPLLRPRLRIGRAAPLCAEGLAASRGAWPGATSPATSPVSRLGSPAFGAADLARFGAVHRCVQCLLNNRPTSAAPRAALGSASAASPSRPPLSRTPGPTGAMRAGAAPELLPRRCPPSCCAPRSPTFRDSLGSPGGLGPTCAGSLGARKGTPARLAAEVPGQPPMAHSRQRRDELRPEREAAIRRPPEALQRVRLGDLAVWSSQRVGPLPQCVRLWSRERAREEAVRIANKPRKKGTGR